MVLWWWLELRGETMGGGWKEMSTCGKCVCVDAFPAAFPPFPAPKVRFVQNRVVLSVAPVVRLPLPNQCECTKLLARSAVQAVHSVAQSVSPAALCLSR